MTAPLKQGLLHLLGLTDPGDPRLIRAHRMKRAMLRSDERLRNDYLRITKTPKLHIGGGWTRLDGWLNADIAVIPGVMHMDATQHFPFADSTFDLVYTEHMIEHISYRQAANMLRECFRVMREGAAIRVITPDLATVVGLYSKKLSADQETYLSWFCRTFVPEECPANAASAINVMFREWGHQFIYDEALLRTSMEAAGFRVIERCALGESRHSELRNMENQQRYPAGLLNFESLALEGMK